MSDEERERSEASPPQAAGLPDNKRRNPPKPAPLYADGPNGSSALPPRTKGRGFRAKAGESVCASYHFAPSV